MRLLICDSSPNPVNRYIGQSIFRAASASESLSFVRLCYQATLADTLDQHDFDQLLIVDGQSANTNVIARARARVQSSSVWFFEDPYELKTNVGVARDFHKAFTNEISAVEAYEKNCTFMPLAADPAACFFQPRANWPIDICHIGSAWPNRCKTLFALHEVFPGLNWHVRLLVNGFISPILKKLGYLKKAESLGWVVTDQSLSIRDVAALSNQSRISLSLPRSFSPHQPEHAIISRTPAPRVFETALAGSCQIISAETRATMSRLHYGDMVPSYSDFNEMCSQIELLLRSNEECFERARAAQAVTQKHHTYRNRIAEIQRELPENRETRPRPAARQNKTLIVAHNFTTSPSFGGVEVFVERLLHEMKDKALVAYPRSATEKLQKGYVVADHEGEIVEHLDTKPRQIETLEDPEIETWLEEVIVKRGISDVLFAHLMRWPVSLVRRLKALGVTTTVVLNEFFYLCPSFNLLSAADVFCARDILGPDFCDRCLLEKFRLAPGTMATREAVFGDMLMSASHVIAPSECTRSIYEKILPQLKRDILIEAYPIPSPVKLGERSKDGVLKVLVAGTFVKHKGADEVIEIIRLCKGPVEFHLCGFVEPEYRESLEELKSTTSRVTLHGSYAPAALPPEFSTCDVALFLSIWPETYLIALTEAMLLGCVPIIFNIGAQAERVTNGVDGFVFNVGDVRGVAQKLDELSSDKSPLEELRQKASATSYVSTPEYAGFLQGLSGARGTIAEPSLHAGFALPNQQLGIDYLKARSVRIKVKIPALQRLKREARRVGKQIAGRVF